MIVDSKITDEERRRLKNAASLRSVLEHAISGLEALGVKGIEDVRQIRLDLELNSLKGSKLVEQTSWDCQNPFLT